MKKIECLMLLALGLFVGSTALGADDIIVPNDVGQAYLKDNGGSIYPLAVGYTTDGNNKVLTLNGSTIASDDIITNGYGSSYLKDSMSRLLPLQVLMTTDGNGNVIPVTGGGGGGGGAVASVFGRTGSVSAQSSDYSSYYDATGSASTAQSNAETFSANPSNITQDATHRFTSDTEKATWNGKQDALGFTPYNSTNPSSYVNAAGASSAAPVQSVAGRTGNVVISNTDVSGLGTASTNNTGDFDASGAAAAAQSASLQKTNNLSDLQSAVTARTNLGLGTAAVTNSSAYDASGAAAAVLSSSLQIANNLSDVANMVTARTNLGLSTVAHSGSYADLLSLPTLGTASTHAATDFQAAGIYVNTFNGRSGTVVPAANDYSYSQLSGTPTPAPTAAPPFVADTTSTIGVQGIVPAPPIGTTEGNNFLTGSGFAYVDQQKALLSPNGFAQVSWVASVSGNQKHQNVMMIQNGGKTYAVVGGGTTKTITIYDVTDQAIPRLRGSITLSGTYGACGSNASWPYVFVPASGARTLTVLNISNPDAPVVVGTPYSWAANTTSIYSCAYANGLVFMAGQSHGLGILDVGNGVSGGTINAPVLSFDEGTLNGIGQICNVTNSCKSFGVAVDAANSIVYSSDYSTATPWTYRQLKAYSYASSITAPTLLQNLTLPANTAPKAISLNFANKTAFVTDTNQNLIDVVDTTNVSTGAMANLSTLTPTGSLGSQGAAVSYSGSNYAYVPSGSASVEGQVDLFDLTNRSSPIKVKTITTLSNLTGVSTSTFGGLALDPRGGYLYAGDYGTGTAGSGLDIFQSPLETETIGTQVVSQLTIKSILQLPKQASGVTPTCAAAVDDGKVAITSAHVLCICNGSTPGWFDVATGLSACTF
jgi:hypothetical protein